MLWSKRWRRPMKLNQLYGNSMLAVATAACTYIASTFIIPFEASTKLRKENEAIAYSEYSKMVIQLFSVRNEIYVKEKTQESLRVRINNSLQQDERTEINSRINRGEEKLLTLDGKLDDARSDYFEAAVRIAIYGSSETLTLVKSVTEAVTHGTVRPDKKQLVELLEAMREHVGSDRAQQCDLWGALFLADQDNGDDGCQ